MSQKVGEKLLREPIFVLRCSMYYSYTCAPRTKLGSLATFFTNLLFKHVVYLNVRRHLGFHSQ